MSMRVGTVNGKTVKRVRKNSDGTTQVQPVKIDPETKKLVNDGNQFICKPGEFKKHKLS